MVIDDKFEKWTKGLGDKEKRISIFNHIRDIEYAIVPGTRNYSNGPEKILKLNRGSCTPKHFLLGMMLERIKIPIKYVTYPYSWNDPKISYPKELAVLAKKLPTEYHLACKAFIENRWVNIDATWDIGLKKPGFPVNENWDGVSNTQNAVTSIDEIIHENAAERELFVTEKLEKRTDEQNNDVKQFIAAFNDWLDKERRLS